jgi:NTE family protein
MTVAFVLSGGASLGSIQVGMLQALSRAGIRPDLVVGASVGALNGAWVAGDPSARNVDRLADTWEHIDRNDIFPLRPLHGLLGFLGREQSLVPNAGLRRLLGEHLTFERLEQAPVRFNAVAVDVLTGRDVCLSSGNAVDAITASAAIPGIFPPVVIDGRPYMDGGVVNNTPISVAHGLGADTIWVLPTGYACALSEPPKGSLGMALHGLSVLVQHGLAADVVRFEALCDLRVVPPLCPVNVSPADFRHSREFIDRARVETERWLADPERRSVGQAATLTPHTHD